MGHDRRDLGVGACLHQPRERPHLRREPEEVADERHGVDAEVEQRAATQREIIETVRGIVGDPLRVIGEHRPDLAQGSGGDDLAQADHVREVASPHRLHDEDARVGCQIAQRHGLVTVEGERLLHQHVLAVLDRERGGVAMTRMRGGDVDDVDVGVGRELLVRAVSVGMPYSSAKRVAESCVREPTATTSRPAVRRSRVNAWAIPPVARMPHRRPVSELPDVV